MTDQTAIKLCLEKFESHPFSSKSPKFRTINPSVKILGIGANVKDTKRSDYESLNLS